jgi:uncharacterized coiled-coil protein SlyX
MTLPPTNSPWPQRLSEQLQSLSQLSETLTLRLLELEERLAGCEALVHRLDGVSASAVDGSAVAMDLLEQTDVRIGRLESLLAKDSALFQSSGAAQPRLQVLHAQPVPSGTSASVDGSHPAHPLVAFGDDPFPEEAEQAFMDELSA